VRRRRRSPGGPRLQAGRPGGDRGIGRGRLLLHGGPRRHRRFSHHAGHRQARARGVPRRRVIPDSRTCTAAPWRSPRIFANIPAGRRRTWRGSRRPRSRIRLRPRVVAPLHTPPPSSRAGSGAIGRTKRRRPRKVTGVSITFLLRALRRREGPSSSYFGSRRSSPRPASRAPAAHRGGPGSTPASPGGRPNRPGSGWIRTTAWARNARPANRSCRPGTFCEYPTP